MKLISGLNLCANPVPKRLFQFRIGSGSGHNFRIRPVPDPQHWVKFFYATWIRIRFKTTSVADPGFLSRILIYTHPGSRFIPIPDPGEEKNLAQFLMNFPGVKKAPNPGSGSATLKTTRQNCALMHPGSRNPVPGSRIQKQKQNRGIENKYVLGFGIRDPGSEKNTG